MRGVHVVMAVRNVSAGLAAKEAVAAKIPGARVDVLELDLSSMASVRRFASEFQSLNLPLNILINNAGVMTRHCKLSRDGLELHFATNHIGVSSIALHPQLCELFECFSCLTAKECDLDI